MDTPSILVLNGPNLQKLGNREVDIYGERSLEEINTELSQLFPDVIFKMVQSDLEGELIRSLNQAESDCVGVVLNAGGYTHTSVAIRDAIASMTVPVIEVHLSNILAREPFRHTSLIGGVCIGGILGFGMDSYRLAVDQLIKRYM